MLFVNKYYLDNLYFVGNFYPDIQIINNSNEDCIDNTITQNFSIPDKKYLVCVPSFDDFFNSKRYTGTTDTKLKKFTKAPLPDYNTYIAANDVDCASATGVDYSQKNCLETCYEDNVTPTPTKWCSCTSISEKYWFKKQSTYNTCESNIIFLIFRTGLL